MILGDNRLKKRNIGQRISIVAAVLCYLSAVICFGTMFYFNGELGGDDPVVSSLGATIVFFLGTGVVLHVIGRANLPDLKIDK